MKTPDYPAKNHKALKEQIRAEFLQYRAELNQGLNELAGQDPLEQATHSLLNTFKDIAISIIGEDEPTKIPNAKPGEQQEYHDPVIRNQLRATQTNLLKNLE